MQQRIVFGGPSNSGKSTLVASLYLELCRKNADVGLHEIDVYSDTLQCILGTKPWEKRRKRVKAWYIPTIKRRIDEFASDSHALVLGDLPGKLSNTRLPEMVEYAHAAVIVARTWEQVLLWEERLSYLGVPTIARVVSYIDTLPLVPPRCDALLISNLNRVPKASDEISALSALLLEAKVAKEFTAAAE